MIRLAIIRQRYNPFGGAERFVERALAGLAATAGDLDVTLITRRWDGPDGGHRRLTCDPFYLGSTWRDEGFRHAACATVAREGFDLVQAHEKVACCDLYRAGDGLHRAWLARRQRILGAGGRLWMAVNPYNHATLAAEEALFRSPRLKTVVCISELVKREIQEHFDLPEERLPVIYNGIDPTRFNPEVRLRRQEVRQRFGVPNDVPLFLFLGSGYERKGLARALMALPREAWLLVVGKDKHESRYKALAERLGVSERVRFCGPQQAVLDFYGAADAFVFPTVYEPFGNVILEAMACGLPVVTTPDCGGADLVREGGNGFVRPGEDRDALAEAMERLLDGTLAERLGKAAASTAATYDLERMTGQMVALYRRLLSA